MDASARRDPMDAPRRNRWTTVSPDRIDPATRMRSQKILPTMSIRRSSHRLTAKSIDFIANLNRSTSMKFMILVKATADSEAGKLPDENLLTAMGKYNEELVNAGIMRAGDGLHPSSNGARVRFSGTDRTVVHGPFAQTSELVAGYWIWETKDLDEAIAWVKRCPNPMYTDSEIEIRRVFTAEDFGDVMTPELREQEARLASRLDEIK
jgi:hypothetical protein